METTIRYYRRNADGTVWAILCVDGKPSRAAGPVEAPADGGERELPPPEYVRQAGVDASGWDLAEFTPADRNVARLTGGTPRDYGERTLRVDPGSFSVGLIGRREQAMNLG